MDAIILQVCDKSRSAEELARHYWAAMVDARQVRAALRQLRTDANMSPEEFADDAKVNRATVYRIEALETNYAPRIDTVSALVTARGLTLSEFFGKIEGLTTTRQTEAELPSSTPSTPKADHGRSLSAEARSADSFVEREILAALVGQLADAIDRLVDARTQDRLDKDARPARRRGTGEGR